METQIGRFMKNFVILIALITVSAYAGTCTSISRTNYTTGQVLTSSSLNTNLNTVYSAVNALDGGCVTDGTLEDGALNTTDFETLLKAPQMGCSVSYSSANTVTISKCYLAVNGNYVQKPSTTNVTMGCTNCSADSASTTYYVYIATGSSGSTLTGLILTTAPNADGYDNSGNKVIARFYNNASSDIDQYSIDMWKINSFHPSNTAMISFTPTTSWVSNTTATGLFRREGKYMVGMVRIATSGAPTSTSLSFDIPSGYLIDTAFMVTSPENSTSGHGVAIDAGNANYLARVSYSDTNTLAPQATDASASYLTFTAINATVPFTWGASDTSMFDFRVPITGWNN